VTGAVRVGDVDGDCLDTQSLVDAVVDVVEEKGNGNGIDVLRRVSGVV